MLKLTKMSYFINGTRHSDKLTSHLDFSQTDFYIMLVIGVKIKIKNSNKNKLIFKKDVNGVFFAIYVLVRQQRHSPACQGGT
ncbi:MAG: hypothetical protein K2W92_06710 [Alphaproteobacteria bacterium]|nr:hypothetical protein [Alphaproteobacteria bacterium]